MTIRRAILSISILLFGCFQGGDDSDDEIGDTSTDTGDVDTTSDMTDTTSTTDDTTDTTETETGDPPADFMFPDDPPDAYTRVDRMGMPAIATAMITNKDNYNAANPVDDAMGTFAGEMAGNVSGLHMALDDDLMGAGLVPCPVAVCVSQAGPLVIPDTLKIDLTGTAGFPNGRRPTDPVIDVTLAVVMLDLAVMGQDATTLANLPLNPAQNDVPFSPNFPYLAPPH